MTPSQFGITQVPDVQSREELYRVCGQTMARELLSLPKDVGLEPALLLIRDKETRAS